ncbi:MAG: hypothetical protein RL662_1219 [Bacteroidota bacterium]|jgi:regulatory protein
MKKTEAQALAKVAGYCSKAERAEFDVRKKLLTMEMDGEVIDRIISRLKSEKFLDDERYCRSFIKDKIRFNRWGEVKIRFELRKKKIGKATVNRCFADIETDDVEEQLCQLLLNKAKTVKAASDYEKQTKLFRFALGRGYTVDQIKRCLKKSDYRDEEFFESFS